LSLYVSSEKRQSWSSKGSGAVPSHGLLTKQREKKMEKTFKTKEKCKACKGTGVFIGMAEHAGAGIVCYDCKGTGSYDFVHTYDPFKKREVRENVKRVFETNPGISIGENSEIKLEDFGGIPYKDWVDGKPFGKGAENRKFTCPAWWFQSADYEKKPDWRECYPMLGGPYLECPHFGAKEKCWERFDNEHK